VGIAFDRIKKFHTVFDFAILVAQGFSLSKDFVGNRISVNSSVSPKDLLFRCFVATCITMGQRFVCLIEGPRCSMLLTNYNYSEGIPDNLGLCKSLKLWHEF